MHAPALVALVAFLLAAVPSAGPRAPALPPVEEVQRQAILHARLDLAEVTSWKRLARRSALVPRLQVEYANRLRNTVDVNVNDNVYVGSSGVVVGPEDGSYKNNASSDHYVSVRAIWELGEAVFHPGQIAVSAEARNVLRERNLLLAEINRHYFRVQSAPAETALLRRQIRDIPHPEKLERELFLRGVACEESAAALDGLTGGWWRAQLGDDATVCPPAAVVRNRGER